MIYNFILLLLILNVAASDDDCLEPITDTSLSNIAIPNCTKRNLFLKEKKLKLKTSTSVTRPICDTCKANFLTNGMLSNAQITKNNKSIYFESMYGELLKNISSSLVEISSLRNLPSTNIEYAGAKKECNANSFVAKLKSKCSPEIQKTVLQEKGFQQRIGLELTSLVSSKRTTGSNGILNRPANDSSCEISDQAITSLKPIIAQELVNNDIINLVISSKATTPEEIRNIFANVNIGSINLRDVLLSHPLLSSLSKNPSQFISFFKSIPNPKDNSSFTQALYSKDNGKFFDSTIAKRCGDAYDTFINKVCSKDFEDSNIDVSPIENFERISSGNDEDLVSTPSMVDENLKLFSFCDEFKKPNAKLKLSNDLDKLNNWLPENFAKASLRTFSDEKYDEDFSQIRNSLCSYQTKLNGSKCDDPSYNCTLYNKLLLSRDPSTSEGRLASSPDKAINELLGSFVGDTTSLTPETKLVLINEGIIPKSDGKYAAKPDVPERKPDYLAKAASRTRSASSNNNQPSPTIDSASTPTPTTVQAASRDVADSYPAPTAAASSTTNTTNAATTALANEAAATRSQLADVQNNILKKLLAAKKISPQPLSNTAVTNLADQAFRESNEQFSDLERQQIINNVYSDPKVATAIVPLPSSSIGPAGTARLSRGENANDKLREKQANVARAGMAGARESEAAQGLLASAGGAGSGSGTAIPTTPTPSENASARAVTVVALNEGTQQNIAELLTEKVQKEDMEGKRINALVMGKKDFILKLNGVSFKVLYQENTKGFIINFDSGDQSAATRLKPQLENFFNKLQTRSVRLDNLRGNLQGN